MEFNMIALKNFEKQINEIANRTRKEIKDDISKSLLRLESLSALEKEIVTIEVPFLLNNQNNKEARDAFYKSYLEKHNIQSYLPEGITFGPFTDKTKNILKQGLKKWHRGTMSWNEIESYFSNIEQSVEFDYMYVLVGIPLRVFKTHEVNFSKIFQKNDIDFSNLFFYLGLRNEKGVEEDMDEFLEDYEYSSDNLTRFRASREDEWYYSSTNDYKKLSQYLYAYNLAHKRELFLPLIKNRISINLRKENDSRLRLAASKLGGKPHVASNFIWPKTKENHSLSFIAQINFKDLDTFEVSEYFPESGLVSFFFCLKDEAWFTTSLQPDFYHVIYTEDTSQLKRYDTPKDLKRRSSILTNNVIFFRKNLSLPANNDCIISDALTDDEYENYIDLNLEAEHQLLGYANDIQGTMEDYECNSVAKERHLFRHGNLDTYQDTKPEDWTLLLQIGDDDNTGVTFGDCGRIYFWITKDDLKYKRFENCIGILHNY